MMPPAGMPRPEAAAFEAFVSHLETSIDRSACALRFQHGVEEKQVGEQCAQVNGGVQVVHELRAD